MHSTLIRKRIVTYNSREFGVYHIVCTYVWRTTGLVANNRVVYTAFRNCIAIAIEPKRLASVHVLVVLFPSCRCNAESCSWDADMQFHILAVSTSLWGLLVCHVVQLRNAQM